MSSSTDFESIHGSPIFDSNIHQQGGEEADVLRTLPKYIKILGVSLLLMLLPLLILPRTILIILWLMVWLAVAIIPLLLIKYYTFAAAEAIDKSTLQVFRDGISIYLSTRDIMKRRPRFFSFTDFDKIVFVRRSEDAIPIGFIMHIKGRRKGIEVARSAKDMKNLENVFNDVIPGLCDYVVFTD